MYNVNDNKFKRYGKVLSGFWFREFIITLEEDPNFIIDIPKDGNNYFPSIQYLEESLFNEWLKENIYGGLEIQLGLCTGHSKEITAVEYHQGSETITALTDCILKVGHVADIEILSYDEKFMECFFLESGQAVELYGTTLHYTPIEVSENGYAVIIGLLKGTNSEISKTSNSLLLAKNKFMLVHPSRKDKIYNGALPGFINNKLEYKIENF